MLKKFIEKEKNFLYSIIYFLISEMFIFNFLNICKKYGVVEGDRILMSISNDLGLIFFTTALRCLKKDKTVQEIEKKRK